MVREKVVLQRSVYGMTIFALKNSIQVSRNTLSNLVVTSHTWLFKFKLVRIKCNCFKIFIEV